MKAFLAAALMLLGASHARAAGSPELSVAQDPLMRQIRIKAEKENGGITSFAAIKGANGEKVVIPLTGGSDAPLNGGSAKGGISDPMKALNPNAGLVAQKQGGAAGETVKTPGKQLRRIEDKRSWK
jgi:hypothetical protein